MIKDLKAAEENCQKKKREYENLRKAQDKSQVRSIDADIGPKFMPMSLAGGVREGHVQ